MSSLKVIQLRALLRKNAILTFRNKRDMFREFGSPVLLVMVLVLISSLGRQASMTSPATRYPTTRCAPLSSLSSNLTILVSPCGDVSSSSPMSSSSVNTTDVTHFAQILQSSFAPQSTIKCFACESGVCQEGDVASSSSTSSSLSLLAYYATTPSTVFGAVVFDSFSVSSLVPPGTGPLPTSPIASYRIRMDPSTYVDGVDPDIFIAGYGADGRVLPPSNSAASAYVPFLAPFLKGVDAAIAQTALLRSTGYEGRSSTDSDSISDNVASSSSSSDSLFASFFPFDYTLSFRQFPSLAYSLNAGGVSLSAIVPLYMTIIFTLQVRVLLTRILEEKEKKTKISLQMQGLRDDVFWVSWLITAGIKNTLVVIVVVVLATVGKLFEHSSPLVIFVFYFIFELNCIGYSCAITALFSKARTGGAVGMLIYLILAGPSYALSNASLSVPSYVKFIMSLLAPCGFTLGNSILSAAESAGTGITWENLWDRNIATTSFSGGITGSSSSSSGSSSEGISLGELMMMLLLDAVLYMLLAVYLNRVVPTEFGVTSHPLFCLGFRKKIDGVKDIEQVRIAREQGIVMSHGGAGGNEDQLKNEKKSWSNNSWMKVFNTKKKKKKAPTRRATKDSLVPASASTTSRADRVALASGGSSINNNNKKAQSMSNLPLLLADSDTNHHGESQSSSSSSSYASKNMNTNSTYTNMNHSTAADFEPVTAEVGSRPGVHIQNLCKLFPGRGEEPARLAVDDLSVSFYENQVSVLLGHNGAGKTTAIGMATGLFQPTAGDIMLYGTSIVTDPVSVRDMIGVCPQHDILFDLLTVREHLVLYGGVKGLVGTVLDTGVDTLIRDLGLVEKENSFAGTLSGGQKRRLSVALALIGDPKCLWLDEPTANCDPEGRRNVWSVIQRYKQGRVIVLTTHFMDEADILGDRIAIMARGSLRVCGSPLFLKARFGLGYHLTITTRSLLLRPTTTATGGGHASSVGGGGGVLVANTASQQQQRVEQSALAFVTSHVASATLQSAAYTYTGITVNNNTVASGNVATGATASNEADMQSSQQQQQQPALELTFLLPRDQVASFPVLYDTLENHVTSTAHDHRQNLSTPSSSELTVASYSISMPTMESVFLRLATIVEEEEQAERDALIALKAAKERGDGEEEEEDDDDLGGDGGSGFRDTDAADDEEDEEKGEEEWGNTGLVRSTSANKSSSTTTRSNTVSVNPLAATMSAGSSSAPSSSSISISSSPTSAALSGKKSKKSSSPAISASEMIASNSWWLDVRRRLYGHNEKDLKRGISEASVLSSSSMSSSGASVSSSSSTSAFWTASKIVRVSRFSRQVSAQLWRRYLQIKRDYRQLWLQCVTPIIFSGISLAFQVLKGLGNAPASEAISFDPSVVRAGLPFTSTVSSSYSIPSAILPPGDTTLLQAFVNQVDASFPLLNTNTMPIQSPSGFNGVTQPTSNSAADGILLSNTTYALGAALFSLVAEVTSSSFALHDTSTAANISDPRLFPPFSSAIIPKFDLLFAYNSSITVSPPVLVSLFDSAMLAAALSNLTSSTSISSFVNNIMTMATTSTAFTSTPLLRASFDPLPPVPGSGGAAGNTIAAGIGDYLAAQLMGLYLGLGYCTIPALQATAVVAERETRSKQMQFIMGATPTGYWFATWLFDVLLYIFPWVGGLAIIYGGGPAVLRGDNAIGPALLLLLMGLSIPLPTYVVSFLFTKATDAQVWVRVGFTVFTMVFFFVSLILEFPSIAGGDSTSATTLQTIGTVVQYIGMTFPPYALAKGISSIGVTSAVCAASVQAGVPCTLPSVLSWDVAGAKIVFMLLSIPIWTFILLGIENEWFAMLNTQNHQLQKVGGAASLSAGVHTNVVVSPLANLTSSSSSSSSSSAAIPRHSPNVMRNRAVVEASTGNNNSNNNNTIEDEDVHAERARVSTIFDKASENNLEEILDAEGKNHVAVKKHNGSQNNQNNMRANVGVAAVNLRKVFAGGRTLGKRNASNGTTVDVPSPANVSISAQQQQQQQQQQRALLPKVAVADLSIACNVGDIFGILGPNGAGKTTTFSMLVGEVSPTSGHAYIAGHDVTSVTARRQAIDLLGYCPQGDALFDTLTGEETLAYYAALAGVPAADIPSLVDAAVKAVGITLYRRTRTAHYSGGNKRRLSLAIAYVGAPVCVFLDEISAGVDPVARRLMFEIINTAREGRTTLITTHVMEEADALCSRIGIMVSGRLSCLGSSQHLKSKYGRGYVIDIQIAEDEERDSERRSGINAGHGAGREISAVDSAQDYIPSLLLREKVCATCTLVEKNGGHLRFEASSIKLGQCFRILERDKQSLRISEYSLSQTTLEQVYLTLSHMQENQVV